MTAPRLRVPAVASATVLVLLAGLVANGRFVLHQCTSADGFLATLGMRLALLGDVTDCPEGSVGLTSAGRGGTVLVLGLALPVLVAHVALAIGGIGLTAAVARVASSVRAIVTVVLPHVLRVPVVVAARLASVVAEQDPPLRLLVGLPAAQPRRGPPLLPA